jgi:P63C domain
MDDDLLSSRAKGGIARREALTPTERARIAKKAAAARWGMKATHRGNFQDQLGIDVECYVLDDENKTAVISQTGMARALGLSHRANALPRFLANKVMTENGGASVLRKIENPLKFQWGTGGAGIPPSIIHGFDSSLLIDICNAIIAAEKKLGERYANVARQAHIVVGGSARLGIRDLVYALAGYNPTADEVISAFKLYVQEEARKYEPEFPNELYMHWHRLYDLPVPIVGKPWQFKFLTVRHIYFPLAKSSGRILDLLRALKAKGGDRRKKLFQFLNIIGARALRIHLGRILEMAEDSATRAEYENRVHNRFGGQLELDLLPSIPSASPTS